MCQGTNQNDWFTILLLPNIHVFASQCHCCSGIGFTDIKDIVQGLFHKGPSFRTQDTILVTVGCSLWDTAPTKRILTVTAVGRHVNGRCDDVVGQFPMQIIHIFDFSNTKAVAGLNRQTTRLNRTQRGTPFIHCQTTAMLSGVSGQSSNAILIRGRRSGGIWVRTIAIRVGFCRILTFRNPMITFRICRIRTSCYCWFWLHFVEYGSRWTTWDFWIVQKPISGLHSIHGQIN